MQNGDLVSIRVDGCQVGYKDRESGLAHFKPSIYITSLLVAESIFNGCRCDGQHAHEPLEGNNKFGSRTLQASEWPEQLNDLVIQAMIQQASAESSAVCGAHEMFPAEVRPAEQPLQGRSPKRRRRAGRVTQLVGQYAAPPVYVRPQLPLQPEVQQPLEDQQLLPDQPQLDDASVRAIQASALDPVLNITEAERRRRWLTISPEIRKILRDLHVQFGHPTNTTLQRILRRQGALPEAIDGADLLSCDSCGDSIRRRRPKPVRLPGRYVFNHHLLIDVFYGKDVVGESFAFLNIIDDATGYQVVSCLGQARGPPASKAVLRHFLTVWSSWAGLPYSAQVDRGKEYLAYFSDHLKTYGVEQETVPLEAPWQNGKVERAGALWKEILYKTVQEMQLQGLDDMILATTIITQCRNSFPRPNGYSPSQWVLGLSEVRVPGSLLDDGEAQRLELLEAADDPTSAFARSLGIRESARVAQVRLDNDARVRRALLHKSTPTRGPYPVGSYVYFYRLQAPPTGQARAQARNFRWFGPARVIGVETRNQRRAEDVEFATEGGQPHAYWLRYGPSVVLVTGEQLRFASEDELLAAHSLPEEVLQPSYTRGARNYVDLRGHAATPQILDQQQDPAPPGLQFSPTTPFAASRPATIREDTEFPGDVVPATPAPQEERTGDEIQEPEPGPSATPTPQVSRRPSKNVPAAAAATQLSQALQRPDRLDGHPTSSGSQQTTTTPSQLTQQQVQQQNTMVPLQPVPPQQLPFISTTQPTSYGPSRTSNGHQESPYFVDEDLWDCPDLPHTVRLRQLQRMMPESEIDSEASEEESMLTQAQPADAFLTGKAASSEISLKNLDESDRQKFQDSMKREWDSWMKFGAVEVLTKGQIKDLPDDTQIVGTRWVHTDKNSKPRLLAKYLSKKTGKSDAQIKKEFPFQAKSRLVVQGCQEDPQAIRSDSPTASLLAFNFICMIATVMNWIISACDASTAYLQSQGISRLLILRPPRPPPPGISPHDLLRARGSIYGTKDAGRSWWKKLFRTLKRFGWRMSRIESAMFLLVIDTKLVGVLITHVDDLFCAGEGKVYQDSISAMEKEIYLKVSHREFRFCGKNVKQHSDGTIELDQFDAIESVDYMPLTKDRRSCINAPLTTEEITSFRGLIGQLGWITRQTRPDLMVNVSVAAQSVSKPRIKDVVNLNKCVKMLKDTADSTWRFVPHPDMKLDDLVVCVFADSSFANIEGMKSQCGYVVSLTLPSIRSGSPTPLFVVETYSGSVKRVCRSTLAAEANGFLTGAEAGEYVRALLLELQHPDVSFNDLEREYVKKKVICITDAKSLESTLNKDAGQPGDKRVRILVAQIREMIGENNYGDDDMVFAEWCDTSQQLADVLTKTGCEREPLLNALYQGVWQLEPSDTALAKKASIRASRRARKQGAIKDGCENTQDHTTSTGHEDIPS